MKTTLKIGMLAAVAALALAGCNNAIPTEPAADSFAYNADQYYKKATKGEELFTVKIDKPIKEYGMAQVSDTRQHQITVTFSHPVTEEAVRKGVMCYKLTSVASMLAMPDQTPETIKEVQVDSMGTTAYLTVNTKDIDHLYVYVTASQMRAVNGALLNSDGDDVWGEPGDDDYAKYFDVRRTPGANLVGNYNHKKETENLNKTLKNAFASLNVDYGTNGSKYLAKTVTMSTSSFEGLLDISDNKVNMLNKFADMLNTHLKLEQYDWKTATWENVPVKFVTDTAKNQWSSNITVKPNRQLRALLVKTDEIQMTGFKRYGYSLKYSLQHNDPNDPKIVDVTEKLSTTNTGYVSLQEGDNWPASDLTWKLASNSSNTNKTIEITLKSGSLGLMDNLFINKWVRLTANNKDASKKSFFAGFDRDTATKKDNFKCFITTDGVSRPLVIKDIIVVQSDVENYPKAFNKIIISSEDDISATTAVYISPNVKTASFTGSYFDGTTYQAHDVPKLRFVQNMCSKDHEELYGWRKINKN